MRRLTETEKWQDPWYRGLPPEQKLAWLYLIDNCDCAGFIELDRALANFQIGFDVDWDSFISDCNARVMKLASGKLFVMHFVEFQCKTRTLNLANNAHLGIFRCFEKHGVNPEEFGLSFVGEPRGYFGPKKGLSSPTGKGIGKGKGNTGECEGESEKPQKNSEPVSPPAPKPGKPADRGFSEFWGVVHRREGKGAARKAFDRAVAKVQQERDWDAIRAITYINDRMKVFAASPQAADEVKGKLHPATWLTQARYDDDDSVWTEGHGEAASRQAASQAANQRFLARRKELRKKRGLVG